MYGKIRIISYRLFIKMRASICLTFGMQHGSTHPNDSTSEYKINQNKINSTSPWYVLKTMPKTKTHMETIRITFILIKLVLSLCSFRCVSLACDMSKDEHILALMFTDSRWFN